MGYDRTLRASLANMKKIVVDLPVDSSNDFDEAIQTELMRKHILLKEKRKSISNLTNELEKTTIDFE